MESSTYKIIWNENVFDRKKKENEEINSEPILLARMFADPSDKKKLPPRDSKQWQEREKFCTYIPKPAKIVVWPIFNKQKIMFKFELDHFSWNTYNDITITYKNYYSHLKNIRDSIIRNFPNLYNGVEFISYVESLCYWNYKHNSFLTL